MFEKEAEERARKLEEKQTLGVYDNDEDLARDEGFNEGEVVGYEQGFKDGAELGYNKAKKELAERLDEAKEMLEQFIKFSMFPLTTKKDIEDVQILLKSASQFCKEME